MWCHSCAWVQTVGHALFNIVIVCWMLIAIQLEERDTAACLGSQYTAYKAKVPMLIPCITAFRGASQCSTPKGEQSNKVD